MTNQTPSSLLSHRYKVICLLGDGGFGKTFLVEDTQIPSNRRCVVKQLKPVHDNPQIHQIVKERFQREAAILERLGDSHDLIPRLYAYFSEHEQFYLVEEWIEGDTLTQRVQRQGVQSEEIVRSMLMQLLPTIAYVHQQQIVHRDIKPDNIILRQRDGLPVLIDFGAVKESMSTIVNSQGNSTHSIVVGTPGYMPAEQLAGRPMFASDIYSLGMTAIYLLTGKIPQQFDTHPLTGELNWKDSARSTSPEFTAILNQAVQMHSHHRFATAEEMLAALQSLSTAVTIAPQVPVPPATVVSGSASNISTQAIAPVVTTIPTPQPAASGEWKKSVMIGGIIGLSILGGALMLRSQTPNAPTVASQPTPVSPAPTEKPGLSATTPVSSDRPPSAQTTDPTSTPTTQSKDATQSTQNQIPSASEGTGTGDSDAAIIDKDSTTNVRAGAGTNYAVKYVARSGDRVRILDRTQDSGGYAWYRVNFPKSGAEGWIAGQLLQPDTQPNSPPPSPKPEPAKNNDTNAILIGDASSKNIRTGPGTNYPTQHIAYPGDRVRILDSAQDSSGYLWYKVYFPKSGADGWIAGQLIKVD